MDKIHFSLLRGVCQTPAYVAYEHGFFAAQGLDVEMSVTPTAWLVPERLGQGQTHFAVIPWTRVAAAESGEAPLKLLAGSGREEAAIVVKNGCTIEQVERVAVPREGGMKDLTAMALIESLGWSEADLLRFPSGDGAIISFFGQGAEAASMIEPYATMMEKLGVGTVVKRTGDIWPGAPGCSLCATAELIEENPDLVQRVVNAYVAATRFVHRNPREAAAAAERYIGIRADFIADSLAVNRPDVDAIRNQESMNTILNFMLQLDYISEIPREYCDLRFLDRAQQATDEYSPKLVGA
jgi:NitT/TauT family transport system substrate-binding protein